MTIQLTLFTSKKNVAL